MRIASLVPSATESLYALGLGDDVVAVTHECDWPERARSLPQLTRSVIEEGLAPAEIDAAVRDLTSTGEAIYTLDEASLAALEPDLIVTQALCAVCAVSFDDVCAVASGLPGAPEVISLDPMTLDAVLDDLLRLGDACGAGPAGKRLRDELRQRLVAVERSVAGKARPRVLALEWLDPPFVGGHWVPEMIALAGGTDPIGAAGAKSVTATWKELEATKPDIVVVMPCGMYEAEASAHARDYSKPLAALGASKVVAVDAAASYSRPGPRLVDGVEQLAEIIHGEGN